MLDDLQSVNTSIRDNFQYSFERVGVGVRLAFLFTLPFYCFFLCVQKENWKILILVCNRRVVCGEMGNGSLEWRQRMSFVIFLFFSLYFCRKLLFGIFLLEKRKLFSCNFVFELYFFINRHPNTLILFFFYFFHQQSSRFKVYFSKHLVLRGSHIESWRWNGRIF